MGEKVSLGGSLWAWRGLGLALLLVLFGALIWLAGRAEEIRARAWEKALASLAGKLGTLPPPLRGELQGALVCLQWRRQAGLVDTASGGAFLRETHNALSDERLDPEEAQRLIVAARALCGTAP